MTSWLESCLCVESAPLPGAGCVPVSRRFGRVWLRSAVPKLRGARWWEMAPAGGVGVLSGQRAQWSRTLSPRGSRGELWPGWRPGGLDVAAPPCLWSQAGGLSAFSPPVALFPRVCPPGSPGLRPSRPHLTCSPARRVGSGSSSPVL